MTRFIRKLIAKWKYRKISYGTCCCGSEMDKHSILDNHLPRDAKEYAITSYADGKYDH